MTRSQILSSFVLLSLSNVSALAGADPKSPLSAPVAAKEKSVLDRIWSLENWYENEDNPILQAIRFTGRFHLQHHWADLDTGTSEDLEFRRFRVGLELDLFREFMIKAEMDAVGTKAVHDSLRRILSSPRHGEVCSTLVGKTNALVARAISDGLAGIIVHEAKCSLSNVELHSVVGHCCSSREPVMSVTGPQSAHDRGHVAYR
jgi:hypothetical protein